jgi:hypothetical protein
MTESFRARNRALPVDPSRSDMEPRPLHTTLDLTAEELEALLAGVGALAAREIGAARDGPIFAEPPSAERLARLLDGGRELPLNGEPLDDLLDACSEVLADGPGALRLRPFATRSGRRGGRPSRLGRRSERHLVALGAGRHRDRTPRGSVVGLAGRLRRRCRGDSSQRGIDGQSHRSPAGPTHQRRARCGSSAADGLCVRGGPLLDRKGGGGARRAAPPRARRGRSAARCWPAERSDRGGPSRRSRTVLCRRHWWYDGDRGSGTTVSSSAAASGR